MLLLSVVVVYLARLIADSVFYKYALALALECEATTRASQSKQKQTREKSKEGGGGGGMKDKTTEILTPLLEFISKKRFFSVDC